MLSLFVSPPQKNERIKFFRWKVFQAVLCMYWLARMYRLASWAWLSSKWKMATSTSHDHKVYGYVQSESENATKLNARLLYQDQILHWSRIQIVNNLTAGNTYFCCKRHNFDRSSKNTVRLSFLGQDLYAQVPFIFCRSTLLDVISFLENNLAMNFSNRLFRTGIFLKVGRISQSPLEKVPAPHAFTIHI